MRPLIFLLFMFNVLTSLSLGLIIRDDPAAVGDYVANYIAKR